MVFADGWKSALRLKKEEYEVYERARRCIQPAVFEEKSPHFQEIIASLVEKGILHAGGPVREGSPLWAREPIYLLQAGYFRDLGIPEKILDVRSPWQRIEVFRNDAFLYFTLNGTIQYHSDEYPIASCPRTVLPASLAGSLRKVLILGGGDGLIAGSLLGMKPAKMTIVEIDAEVSRLFRDNADVRKLSGNALAHGAVEVINDDAFSFVHRAERGYSLIFCDMELHSTRQLVEDPAQSYFSLLSRCSQLLSDEGVFVIMPPIDHEELSFFRAHLLPLLEKHSHAAAGIPSRDVRDWHYFLFSYFFRSVKRIQLKMFFTDEHMIYICSGSEIDDRKIGALLGAGLDRKYYRLPGKRG